MLHSTILFKIGNIEWLARRRITKHIARPNSEWRLLAVLGEMKHISKRGLNQSEIGDILSLSPSACTRLIDRMVGKKYVRRESGSSRRSNFVSLTASGRKLWHRLSRRIEHEIGVMLDGISAERVAETMDVLDGIRDNLEERETLRIENCKL